MLFKGLFARLLPVLAIIGPGIIAGSADNDAGGITTYSTAGANYGYSLLWVLLITTFCLAVTQEVGARLGLVTGKGLASLIREKFGLKWTAVVMVVLLVANMGTIAAEFAGVAAALSIFNIPTYISVPVAAIGIFILVTKGSFKKLERVFLFFSAFYLVYIVSAVLAKPDWSLSMKSLVLPQFYLDKGYLLTLIAVIGTTITPWGQFFIQDYVVDKKLSIDDLKVERGDVFFGAFLTNLFSFFIIVACAATIYASGGHINDAKDAAIALQPVAGQFATLLFSFGLLNAAVFGAVIVPVATAYVVTEAFGLESGLSYSFKEAPEFYGLLAFLLFVGVLLVVIPFFPLLSILVITQAINAVLLIPILLFLYILSNDKKLLGKWANGKIVNSVLGVTLGGIAVCAIAYVISQFI